MRIRIHYATLYEYERPASVIKQVLRVTPRSHEGQHVSGWRIDADADVRLRWMEDAFGNIVHQLQTEQPVDRLTVTVSGEVTTHDTAGVVASSHERLPTEVYLRSTERTQADAALAAFAVDADPGPAAGEVARLHALMGAIYEGMRFEVGATDVRSTAAEAFALRRGVCQDLAHVFVACARLRGVPARYVSGHLLRGEGEEMQDASHAWAEAWVQDLGWVGFDPANGVCATDKYVRVAVGLDYLDAAPVRGFRTGGGNERMTVRLTVRPSGLQRQGGQVQRPGFQFQRLGDMEQSQGSD